MQNIQVDQIHKLVLQVMVQKKLSIITLKIPPTVLDTVAIPRALPASPFCASG